ncbi:hypothetical protein GCM10010406_48260 [Streptomyces thermolineatus]|uniref:Integrase catalytic domain-containing protein n=1 Tax=Streptomyces thermolineatus TaxID=44033 RepID=A0ABN3MTJ0_9ACTN
MRAFSVTCIRLHRRIRTTVPDPAATLVPNLFQRDFTTAEPSLKHMDGITYLFLTGGGSLYFATILDCFSHRVVDWSIANLMHTDEGQSITVSLSGVTPNIRTNPQDCYISHSTFKKIAATQ